MKSWTRTPHYQLPDGLHELHVAYWDPSEFPFHPQNTKLPSQLRVLNVYGCDLERLPSPLPSQLRKLNCNHCRKLQISEIPALPTTLYELIIGAIINDMGDNVTQLLARLPSTLTTLGLNGLKLWTLPPLHQTLPHLQSLDLSFNRLQQ